MDNPRLRIVPPRAAICCLALAIAAPLAAQTTAPQPQWELWKIDADGTGLARFADTPGYSCGSPKWSPDGTLVAYDTRRIEENLQASQVAVMRADGTGLRLLGPGAVPSWSPDGTQLAVHTYQPTGIVVMNADGSGRETLTDHFGSPRWLPTGNRIALIGRDGGLAVFDLTTGVERSLLGTQYSLRPGFGASADGLRYLFGDDSDGLYLATLDPRTMRASVQNVWQFGVCYHASWSPDGTRVVFGWKRNPPGYATPELLLHQLFLLNVQTLEPPVPLAGQDPSRNNTNPDWSPDGKTIIFASQEPAKTER